MVVLKYFVKECVVSIELRGIKTFWSIKTLWLKNCAWRISTIQKSFWIIIFDFLTKMF